MFGFRRSTPSILARSHARVLPASPHTTEPRREGRGQAGAKATAARTSPQIAPAEVHTGARRGRATGWGVAGRREKRGEGGPHLRGALSRVLHHRLAEAVIHVGRHGRGPRRRSSPPARSPVRRSLGLGTEAAGPRAAGLRGGHGAGRGPAGRSASAAGSAAGRRSGPDAAERARCGGRRRSWSPAVGPGRAPRLLLHPPGPRRCRRASAHGRRPGSARAAPARLSELRSRPAEREGVRGRERVRRRARRPRACGKRRLPSSSSASSSARAAAAARAAPQGGSGLQGLLLCAATMVSAE